MGISRRHLLTTAAGAAAATTALAPPAQAAPPAHTAHTAYADDPAATTRTLREAADYAVAKLRAVAPGVTSFPVITKFEKWTYSAGGDWVGGFWPGTLWMAWLHSGDAQFRSLALAAAERLAPRRTDTGTHDLGFLFSRPG